MSAVKELPGLHTDPRTSHRFDPLWVLTPLTVAAVLVGLYMALGYAGTDTRQGDVQRIFYIHMPVFFGAFVAFAGAFISGIAYLRTQDVKWDILALSCIEVGFGLGLVNLITGMVWARPTWNTWWTWDPRLTSSAIMTLTYAAYGMLRGAVENPDKRRRFAAVYAITAIVTVIMTIVVIRIRPDTIHPTVVGASPQNARGAFDVASSSGMAAALGVNMVVWAAFVPVTLIWFRVRLENLLQSVDTLRHQLTQGQEN